MIIYEMSSNESDPFLGVPELQILDELETRQRPIQEALGGGNLSPDLTNLYVRAADKLTKQTSEISSSPGLQDMLARTGSLAIQGFEEIGPIRGVLGEDEIADLETRLQAQLDIVRGFFGKYEAVTNQAEEFTKKILASGGMAVSQVAEVAYEPPPVEATEPIASELVSAGIKLLERDPPRTVSVEDRPEGIRINKILIPSIKIGANKAAKIRLFNFAATLDPTEEHKLIELFGAAFPGELYNRNRVGKIVQWMNHATKEATGEVLFENNDRMTKARRYHKNPGLDIDVVDGQAVGSDKKADDQRDSKSVASEKAKEEDLTATDAYIVARQLHRFNFILKECGLPEITQDLLDALEDHRPDHSHMKNDNKAIEDARAESVAKFRDLLEDEEEFSDLITRSTPNDPLFKFVEYLTASAGDNGLELINQLIGAKICKSVWVTRDNQLDRLVPIAVVDEDGSIIWPKEYNRVGITIAGQRQPQDDQAIEGSLALADEAARADDGIASHRAESEERAVPESERVKELRTFADGIVNEFIAGLDPSRQYLAGAINQLVPRFNVVAIRKILQRSRTIPGIDDTVQEFGLDDVIKVLAFNHKGHKNTMLIKSEKKAVNSAIESAIQSGQEAYDRRIKQQTASSPTN